MMSWQDYVAKHAVVMGVREQRLLAQALEAASILKTAKPDMSDDAAIEAAVNLVAETSHTRAIEENTNAIYTTSEEQADD